MALRIVSYNVRFGGYRRRAPIAAVLRALEPDVVLLQEATDSRVVDWIAEATEMEHAIRRPGWSVALLTRMPVTDATWHRPHPGVTRGFLEVDLADGPRLFGVHLRAGLSGRGERRRLLEVADLLEAVGDPEAAAETLIIGDFNAVAPGDGPLVARMPLWLRLLLRFDGGIRTEAIGRVLEAGFTDVYRRLEPTVPGFTMPSSGPSVRLDYVLAGSALVDRLTVCRPAADVPGVATASDHLPLLVVLDDASGDPLPA